MALIAFPLSSDAQYTINGAQTNQVINGFGVNLNHRSWNNDELKPVLNTMINQGGFTIFRVLFDNTDWVPTNNASQASYNSIYGSARFEKLWDLVDYLNQSGISNGVMFNFQGPGAQWMGGSSLTSGYEPQWAQMISSLITYARNTRHLKFYLVGPDNEPDNSGNLDGVGCNDTQYITMLNLLIQDLNSNGLPDIRLVGPDLATTSTTWMQQMMGSSLIMSNLAHFGLHSYQASGGGSSGVASYIASSSYPNSTFWMTEFNDQCSTCNDGVYNTNNYSWSYCSGTAQYLLYHLANGASAGLAWEGCDSYFELLPLTWLSSGHQASGWDFYGLFGVDNTNAVPKTYTPRKNFYTMAQISAFVPPGSQRIGVSGSQSSSFMMLAFYHAASGRVTLTGFNTGSQTSIPITLQSLPAVASFALYYTDPNNNLNQNATFPVSGSNFTATIPANCIFTLTGFDPAKIAVSVQIANPAGGTQYSAPATIPLAAAASTTTGSITNVEFFSNGTDIGGSTSAPFGITWNNVPPGNYVVTAIATDSAGHTNVSPGVSLSVAGPPAQIVVALTNTTAILPTNATVVPYAQQQFAASVVDALGIPLFPQPAVSWTAGGGTITANGNYTAGGSVGGPFAVIANDHELSGSMGVNIASNVNLAPNGIGYIWYNLSSSTGNSPQFEQPGINDGNTTSNISLLAEYDGSSDLSGAYEAAGVIWTIPQTISNVVFINGSTSSGNGGFAAGFQLQFTLDGSAWFPADSQWTVTPAYNYNSSSGSPVQYVFSGSLATVLGVRCIGQVNTGSHGGSTFAYATEVEASQGAPPTLQASLGTNAVIVSWDGPVTNCVLQSTTDLMTWTTITNPAQYAGGQTSVIVSPVSQQQYFRLQFP